MKRRDPLLPTGDRGEVTRELTGFDADMDEADTGTAGNGGSNPVAGFATATPTLAVATPGTATPHEIDTRPGPEPHIPSVVAVPICGWGRARPSAASNQARMARASWAFIFMMRGVESGQPTREWVEGMSE